VKGREAPPLVIDFLPPTRRAKIEARTKELIAEEVTRRTKRSQGRAAAKRSHTHVAKKKPA